MSSYEIELRGRLSKTQREKLEKFLLKNGKLVKEYERTQWCYRISHKDKNDLRIKKTNGEAIFSLKVGTLDQSNRKEISIPIPEDKFKQAFDFLKHLGYREGIIAVRNAKIYEYKGIEWAIIEVPGHSNFFEAEKIVSKKSAGKAAEEEIRKIAGEIGLNIMSATEFIDYVKILDAEANKKFKL